MEKAGAGAARKSNGLATAAAVIASSVFVLVPVAAQAKGGSRRSCTPSDRWFTRSLHARGVRCSQARGIERYTAGHDWTPEFSLDGRMWHATASSRHGRVYFRFWSGHRVVWLSATGRGLALGSGRGTVSGSRGDPAPPQLQPLGAVTAEQPQPVLVSGHGVAAGQYVLVAGSASVIQADPHGQLSFMLPRDVPAGTSEVRLAAAVPPAGVPVAIPGSAPRMLTVRPDLVNVRSVDNGAAVRAQVLPFLVVGQPVRLSLIALADQTLTPSVRLSITPMTPTTTLDFRLPTSLPAGKYLCIIDVDGVASLPTIKRGVYSGPTVTIP